MRDLVVLLVLSLPLWAALPAGAQGLVPPRPAAVVQADGTLTLAWLSAAGGPVAASVAELRAGAWQTLAPLPLDPDVSVTSVSLAAGADRLWAAWAERPTLGGTKGLVRLAWYNGQGWTEAGPSPSRPLDTVSDRPQVRLDPQGRPWLLWSELAPNFSAESVFLARWDEGTEGPGRWTLVDPGTLTTDISSASRTRDLGFTPEGLPFLAWSWMVVHHDFQVFCGPWSGTRWVPDGGPVSADPDTYAASPSLAFDPQGRPTVAFLEASPQGFRLRVVRRTVEGWAALGAPGGPGARNPSLTFDGAGRPCLLWIEASRGVVAAVWDGASWTEKVVGPKTAGAFPDSPVLVTGPDGSLTALWAEDDAQGVRLAMVRRRAEGPWLCFTTPGLGP